MKQAMRGGAVVLVLAIGAAAGWWWFVYKPQQQELALLQQVEQRVKAALNDPDSAKFRNVRYVPTSRAGCGEVNAKNRMGGYIGYTVFIAFEDGDVRFSPNGPVSFTDSPSEYAAKVANFGALMDANCQTGS